MLKKIKLGLSLIKYGFRPKTNIILCIVLVLVGVIVEIVTKGTNMIGAFYMLLPVIFVYQMIVSMDLSTLVQTSKLKKSLQTTVPAITSLVIYFVVFTFIAIERIILVNLNPAAESDIVASTLLAMIIMFFAMIYMGICFKYYVVGLIIFIIVVMMATTSSQVFFAYNDAPIGIGVTIAIGYVVVAVGALAMYGMSCLFYRKELSKFAFKGIMGKIQ